MTSEKNNSDILRGRVIDPRCQSPLDTFNTVFCSLREERREKRCAATCFLEFVFSAAIWLLDKPPVRAASGQWSRWWQHDVDLHGVTSAESSSPSEARLSSDLPFKCNRCNRGYQVAQSLQRHRWMCEKSRPVICELCLATFYRVDRLRRHMRTVHHVDPNAPGKWSP